MIGDLLKQIFDPFKVVFGDPEKQRILASGMPTRAKIIELNEVGPGYVTVNNQPYVSLKLEIYPQQGASYTTELRLLISRLATSQFQPGNMINVKVDPQDKLKVAFDNSPVENKIVIGKEDDAETFAATAEIIAIKKQNEDSLYQIELKVNLKDSDSYNVTKELTLPSEVLTHFTLGKVYPCRVNKDDRTRVTLSIHS